MHRKQEITFKQLEDHVKSLGMKVRRTEHSPEVRVTYSGLSREREEAVAYYTDDWADAQGTATQMHSAGCSDVQ